MRIRLLEEEYLFALKSFQRNKTPGTDGFWRSSIFVSGMRSPTCNLLTDCFNHGALFGRALHLPRQGIISLIPQTNILCFLKNGGLPLSSETQITNLQRNVSQKGSKKFFPVSLKSKRPSRLHRSRVDLKAKTSVYFLKLSNKTEKKKE